MYWQELALVAGAVGQLALQVPASQLSPFLRNTEHFEYQQNYAGCRIFMPRKIVNYGEQRLSKKEKRCLQSLYLCEILVSVETVQWILDAQLSMPCSLQGIMLCWMCNPSNWWASLNFPFLTKLLCILHLSKKARNAGLCLSLNLHVIPLQSLKIFFLWHLFILLCCLSY